MNTLFLTYVAVGVFSSIATSLIIFLAQSRLGIRPPTWLLPKPGRKLDIKPFNPVVLPKPELREFAGERALINYWVPRECEDAEPLIAEYDPGLDIYQITESPNSTPQRISGGIFRSCYKPAKVVRVMPLPSNVAAATPVKPLIITSETTLTEEQQMEREVEIEWLERSNQMPTLLPLDETVNGDE